MRFFATLLGVATGFACFSMPAAIFMAFVVHGETDGLGDGSLTDMIVFALVWLVPIAGGITGYMRSRPQ